MFNRSLRVGRIAGTDVRLHWSLLLGCAYFYITIPITNAASAVTLTLGMLSVFLSVAAHEFGHTLVAQWLGYRTRQIVLWALGGVAILEREPRSTRDKILIYAAGSLVNLIIAALLATIGWALVALVGPDWSRTVARQLAAAGLLRLNLARLGQMIAGINIVLALFNLLPIYPLDGGQIFRTALAPFLGERRTDQVTLVIGLLLAGGQLIFFAVQRFWLGVAQAILLLLVVGTLNPWFNRKLTLGWVWAFSRGTYYAFYRQDYDRALAYADRQIARGWQVYEHQILRSYLLLKTDQLAGAWAAADQAVRLCPTPNAKRALALNNRGAIAWLQGDAAAARGDLDEALVANPSLHYVYSSRGEIAAHLGDRESALADLTTAIEIAPHFAEARYQRAALLFELGNLEGSLAMDHHNRLPPLGEAEQGVG